jgi:hypothetical protein
VIVEEEINRRAEDIKHKDIKLKWRKYSHGQKLMLAK